MDTPTGSAPNGTENGSTESEPAAEQPAAGTISAHAATLKPSPKPSGPAEPNGAPAPGGGDPSEGKLSVSYFVERVLPRARHTDTVVLLRGAGAGGAVSAETEAAILERKKQRGGFVLALVDVVVGEHDRILCLG